MKYNKGEKLINDLFLNPLLFEKLGKGYRLLQEFFKGMPVEALIPLLKSDDKNIQNTGMAFVSELGDKVCSLMPYVVPFINSDVPFAKYCALECILLCATGEYNKEIIHLIDSINIKDGIDHSLKMFLLSNAEQVQLKEGFKVVAENKINDYKLHQEGLIKLINGNNSKKDVLEMLDSDEPLIQRYGAIISKKMYRESPELINHALLSANPDLKAYAEFIIDLFNDD